jgi:hypothetical protein
MWSCPGFVLGLIHGTQRLLEDGLRDGPVDDNVREIRARLLEEMEIVNGRIVYVIPFSEVAATLDDLHTRHKQ